jgi:phosphoribosylaminoimidazolecarboxamide formyltransferase/IMP cyclohydrolase
MRVVRALISVSDKTGLEELARGLLQLGFELISTGNTYRALQAAGLPARPVTEITGFPEMLDGRVKTLHPHIHAGLLAQPNVEHQAQLDAHGIGRIDLLCVNLYPFRETLERVSSFEECLEQVDIGGPALLRAAAKNHAAVLAVCQPSDYPRVLDALRTGVSSQLRRELAHKAFAHTAAYDAAIAQWLAWEKFPEVQVVALERQQELRYGENPHQEAALYRIQGQEGPVVMGQLLAGKPMSFNNYADAEAAWMLVNELSQVACVAVKHGSPCGVALGDSPVRAWERARDADTLSVFGGVIAFNRPLDLETAQALRGTFLEVLVVPSLDAEALVWIREKKPDLRVVQARRQRIEGQEWRPLLGGMLAQDRDHRRWDQLHLEVVTRTQPTPQQWRDLEFAFYVAKHARSNSIVVAHQGVTVGLGSGAVSRIWAAERALHNAGSLARGAVMVSEAFFPFDDGVRAAAASGIAAVLQPGGARRDAEVIAAADELGLTMVFTGSRHFRH